MWAGEEPVNEGPARDLTRGPEYRDLWLLEHCSRREWNP